MVGKLSFLRGDPRLLHFHEQVHDLLVIRPFREPVSHIHAQFRGP